MNLLEILFKIGLTLAIAVIVYWQIVFLKWLWPTQIDVKATLSQFVKQAAPKIDTIAIRDPNKIYQNGKEVGNIIGEVKNENDTIIFQKISETTNLDKKQPFDYKRDKYKIIKIKKSARLDISSSFGQLKDALTNVVCEKIKQNL